MEKIIPIEECMYNCKECGKKWLIGQFCNCWVKKSGIILIDRKHE